LGGAYSIKRVDYYRPNLNYSFSKLYLGASYYSSFSNYFSGSLDELRISNVVRSQSEIQDYYTKAKSASTVPKNAQQIADGTTIGLWHFDEATPGTTIANSVTGSTAGTLFGNCSFVSGISGNAISFDGLTGRADCNFNPLETNTTIEFWFKSSKPKGTMIQPYGMYSSDIALMTL
jgi:hypothetical protein